MLDDEIVTGEVVEATEAEATDPEPEPEAEPEAKRQDEKLLEMVTALRRALVDDRAEADERVARLERVLKSQGYKL